MWLTRQYSQKTSGAANIVFGQPSGLVFLRIDHARTWSFCTMIEPNRFDLKTSKSMKVAKYVVVQATMICIQKCSVTNSDLLLAAVSART